MHLDLPYRTQAIVGPARNASMAHLTIDVTDLTESHWQRGSTLRLA